jgi:hypothetical protein
MEADTMQYNTCKTCGAGNGLCGNLINDECMNCYDTRKKQEVTIYAYLPRTSEEITKTMSILTELHDIPAHMKQQDPHDQMTAVIMAIEGHISNLQDGIPTSLDTMMERVEDLRLLQRYLPKSW